jgi:hypothetical protein
MLPGRDAIGADPPFTGRDDPCPRCSGSAAPTASRMTIQRRHGLPRLHSARSSLIVRGRRTTRRRCGLPRACGSAASACFLPCRAGGACGVNRADMRAVVPVLVTSGGGWCGVIPPEVRVCVAAGGESVVGTCEPDRGTCESDRGTCEPDRGTGESSVGWCGSPERSNGLAWITVRRESDVVRRSLGARDQAIRREVRASCLAMLACATVLIVWTGGVVHCPYRRCGRP